MKIYFSFILFLFVIHFSLGQNKIGGKVLNEAGYPLSGVTILFNNHGSVISNDEGRFEIIDNDPIEHLKFSKMGY
ncbi:hypothetical protein [Bergeyella sp. RCAD1439]|uniref:hypothetical protein n=1 Tax=Bergeyella anatis TaxID=3113737 RepID=UPI002E19B5C8|nr:hypothetical protein [Bergeyella sp. RCAD1439]